MRANDETWKNRDTFVRDVSMEMNKYVRELRKESSLFFTEKFSIPDGLKLLKEKIIEYSKFGLGGGKT